MSKVLERLVVAAGRALRFLAPQDLALVVYALGALHQTSVLSAGCAAQRQTTAQPFSSSSSAGAAPPQTLLPLQTQLLPNKDEVGRLCRDAVVAASNEMPPSSAADALEGLMLLQSVPKLTFRHLAKCALRDDGGGADDDAHALLTMARVMAVRRAAGDALLDNLTARTLEALALTTKGTVVLNILRAPSDNESVSLACAVTLFGSLGRGVAATAASAPLQQPEVNAVLESTALHTLMRSLLGTPAIRTLVLTASCGECFCDVMMALLLLQLGAISASTTSPGTSASTATISDDSVTELMAARCSGEDVACGESYCCPLCQASVAARVDSAAGDELLTSLISIGINSSAVPPPWASSPTAVETTHAVRCSNCHTDLVALNNALLDARKKRGGQAKDNTRLEHLATLLFVTSAAAAAAAATAVTLVDGDHTGAIDRNSSSLDIVVPLRRNAAAQLRPLLAHLDELAVEIILLLDVSSDTEVAEPLVCRLQCVFAMTTRLAMTQLTARCELRKCPRSSVKLAPNVKADECVAVAALGKLLSALVRCLALRTTTAIAQAAALLPLTHSFGAPATNVVSTVAVICVLLEEATALAAVGAAEVLGQLVSLLHAAPVLFSASPRGGQDLCIPLRPLHFIDCLALIAAFIRAVLTDPTGLHASQLTSVASRFATLAFAKCVEPGDISSIAGRIATQLVSSPRNSSAQHRRARKQERVAESLQRLNRFVVAANDLFRAAGNKQSRSDLRRSVLLWLPHVCAAGAQLLRMQDAPFVVPNTTTDDHFGGGSRMCNAEHFLFLSVRLLGIALRDEPDLSSPNLVDAELLASAGTAALEQMLEVVSTNRTSWWSPSDAKDVEAVAAFVEFAEGLCCPSGRGGAGTTPLLLRAVVADGFSCPAVHQQRDPATRGNEGRQGACSSAAEPSLATSRARRDVSPVARALHQAYSLRCDRLAFHGCRVAPSSDLSRPIGVSELISVAKKKRHSHRACGAVSQAELGVVPFINSPEMEDFASSFAVTFPASQRLVHCSRILAHLEQALTDIVACSALLLDEALLRRCLAISKCLGCSALLQAQPP